jgi:methylmalonyl-CoA mutase N-terminal domain/subunit
MREKNQITHEEKLAYLRELRDEAIHAGSEEAVQKHALEFIQKEIEESAISYQERYRTEQDIIVGVNKYVSDQVDDVDILKVDPESERRQLARLKKWKENRDQAAVDQRLEELREVARADGNLLPPIKEALRAGGSIGEVCNAMRDVFGEYRGGAFF